MSGLGSGLKRLPSRLFVRTGAEVSLHLSISTWQRRPIEDHVHASDTKRCTAEISVNDRPADATGALMSIVKRHLAEHEERLVLIEEICIDTGALILDVATDDVYYSADEVAYKTAYVTVFQAWAKGTIKGTAEQVFEATKSILEN
jgi:hypothetical protein